MVNKLNLPEYSFRIERDGDHVKIFDPIRKKFIVLTPEEWVRQNFIQFLVQEKEIPESLITVETGHVLYDMPKRTDIVAHNRQGSPLLIVECKASTIEISQEVFDQVARYNMTLKVPYLVVTNGLQHYCCQIFHDRQHYEFMKEIPSFPAMLEIYDPPA